MALRDHVEGREAVGVAALSVAMWVGICFVFGLPTVMMWIVGVLLLLGGVLKSSSSTSDDGTATRPRGSRNGKDLRRRARKDDSLYGPPE